ncbi:MAG: protein kinase [Hormoscilla sp. GM102CHS1]|nr:protein kinase [Hormoscilla sp. GM102CHS1]
MSFCINPSCPHPGDPGPLRFCWHCGSPLELEGRYRVLRLLGEGNFGKTFEVSDQGGTRKVLKVLTISDPNCLNNAQCIQQAISLFQREVSVLLQLNHPGIPRVEPGGYFTIQPRNSQELHCLVMEKIEGMNLQQYLRLTGNRPIDNSLAIQWLTELVQLVRYLISTITAFSKPVLKRICSNQHQSKFN